LLFVFELTVIDVRDQRASSGTLIGANSTPARRRGPQNLQVYLQLRLTARVSGYETVPYSRITKARMTNRIYLQMQLQKAVRKYGENAPVTLAIKRQIQEVLSSEGRAKLQHFRRISEARKQVN
jgi:hypothetical protein